LRTDQAKVYMKASLIKSPPTSLGIEAMKYAYVPRESPLTLKETRIL